MADTPKYHWLKRLLRWSGRLLAAMVFLLVGMMALLLVPRVQTFVAAHLANYASERLGVDVHIGRFTVEPFGPVTLKEVFIGDLQGDTLFHIASIRVLRPRIHSADHTIRVSALEVDRLRFKLNRSVGAAHSNLTTLLDQLGSDTTSSDQPDWRIRCARFDLRDVHFSFHDEHEEPIPFGVDMDHIDLSQVTVVGTGLDVIGDSITAQFHQFQFQ